MTNSSVESPKGISLSYLNDLPLKSWDMITNFARFDNLSNYGENNSISAKVCILKEAAKQIIEEHCT